MILQLIITLLLAAAPRENLSWTRLPDLQQARSGHALCELNGELTVLGGHSTGFIPSATAEYFKDGKWHLIPTLYPHDAGYFLPLEGGRVLLGGGSAESFGIGQCWSSALYHSDTHSFDPMPILDRKRALCSAARMPDGRIVVSGNWYAEDAIAAGILGEAPALVKQSAQDRQRPWMLLSGPDDMLIFSSFDTHGNLLETPLVDRLAGDPFEEPLLGQWRPYISDSPSTVTSGWIGDISQGDYSYLLAAQDAEGQWGILLVRNGAFSLLPLQDPFPAEGPGGAIIYSGIILADPAREVAWIQGNDAGRHACLLKIDYKEALSGGKAGISLLCTEALEGLPTNSVSTLLADGRIALAGGMDPDNYTPSAAVFILDPYSDGQGMSSYHFGMLTGLLAGAVLVAAGLFFALRRRRKQDRGKAAETETEPAHGREEELFDRIEALMRDEALYLQKGLTLADFAKQLGTNTKYISSSINACAHCSFIEYVNRLRISHAQELLRTSPGMRLSDIADASGYTSESAFYRNFKAITGCTPAEWLGR
ncbi:MAG: helix-turn-helix domain-containing protein [Bacteroidales bacterium]|nr:helix-turn-helix domain-containing protein [Bacteroidales bacterium]